VTKRLESKIRKEDTLARLGGDEFVIIMEGLLKAEDAVLLAEKILSVMAQSIQIDGHLLYVSCSIGISLYPQDDTNVSNLLKYADTAMYKAKDDGRNNYQFYSADMSELAFERVVMEASLRQALEKNEFIVYYQPQIDAGNGKLIGMEALIRWQHPKMGMVSPAKFIPLAEETGMIVDIDRWVMRIAMKQMAIWHAEGLNPGVLALNLAMKQIQSRDFVEVLKYNMAVNDFKAEWLELEVTEGQVMVRPDDAIIRLKEINDLGIGIAIDDFGTGYSSLSYLKRLPINKLKIDQSFVQDIPGDEEDVAIVKAIIALAQSLNLDLLAEGVETEAQKEFLIKNGCSNIQGYYYSRPVPAEEIRSMFLNKRN
jgi:predicted signal transduction protein with EAL and GGDEF domain